MFKFLLLINFLLFFSSNGRSSPQKSYIEDVFIWKISDELKLSAQEEKKFTEINRALNKKKSELNNKIQLTVKGLGANSSEATLNKYKKLIQEYNQLSISEFDSVKKLLGRKKFISYLKIKNELTSKIRSILISEKSNDEKAEANINPLPPPKVIVEKN